MNRVLCRALVLALGVTLVASAAFAKRTGTGTLSNYSPTMSTTSPTWDNSMTPPAGMNTSAAANTTVLATFRFESGATCTFQTWTRIDATAQLGDFWHVDDFAGMNPVNYYALAGTKSLWCGAKATTTGPICGYLQLPGYGNGWNQAFCTKNCIAVSGDGILDVSFKARFDSEPSYDATSLEYTLDCSPATTSSGWTVVDGGVGVWDGKVPATGFGTFGGAYNIGTTGPVRVRLHFEADGGWSDEDGLWNTQGAVVVDDLVAEGLAVEDFEGEAVGATSSNDWQTCNPAGYGTYMNTFAGASMLQEDPCARDLLCLWSGISGSTYNYACGAHPEQTAVPYVNNRSQYLNNDIWSPDVALVGAGAVVNLEFAVYRDMPLDNLIFYTWGVRTKVGAGCPSAWEDRNFVYYGGQKDWIQNLQAVGDLINLQTGTAMNIRLGVVDMCGVWCGIYGSGACHSHAPLIDNFKVYRVESFGAQWSIRDLDQLHDNFVETADLTRPGTGEFTATGKARADMANDIGGSTEPILPGDSAVVKVADPVSGLAVDGNAAAIYCYVSVKPVQASKTGAALTSSELNPVHGYQRFPYKGSWTDAGGTVWSIIQLDSSVTNGVPQPDIYCVDLNDNLFTPGDEVSFFYAATSTGGVLQQGTYAYGSNLGATGTDREAAAAAPSEFTILPAAGPLNGGDILYVDGMDGRGMQPYFDTAFQSLGLAGKVDRFDVRAPSSGVSNRLAGRVKDIGQLVPTYRKIIWNTGDLSVTLGDGSGTPEKTDDYGLINQFLLNVSPNGGVFLSGDDLPQSLNAYASASAVTFKSSWMPFLLTSANHKPVYGISPVGTAVAGGLFVSDTSMIIYGGCPLINDFDVMTPQGSTVAAMTYGAPNGGLASTNGAVLSRTSGNAGVVMAGFDFGYIRDNDNNGRMDRADFLYDVLVYLNNTPATPTPVSSTQVNSLDQNYPNPFNPQTTIAFSVKDRGLVTLKVYNVAGELVRTLANEEVVAGAHTKVWDGRNDAGQPVSSGVYFYKLVTNNFSQTKKMVLLK